MPPLFTLDKIKFATDPATFERAVKIYESGGVVDFEDNGYSCSAKVRGSQGNFYEVAVTAKYYDRGHCDCYLGEREILCKHMVAVALYALLGGKPLSTEDKEVITSPKCSGRLGVLSKEELSAVKKSITAAMRYIKPCNGPSKIWFAYQNSLSEGCNRLSAIISNLPVSQQTAKLLVDLLLRLDKKLSMGGVDDSDGTVGSFIYETVNVLEEYAKLDSSCIKAFKKLCNQEINFEWQESLIRMVDEQNTD